MTQFEIPSLLMPAKPAEPEIDQETLIRLMVDMAVREMRSQMMHDVRNLLADREEQLLFKIERIIDAKLAEHVPSAKPRPETHLTQPLPPPDQIGRMKVELYENFRKPKAEQPKTQAKVQLRIRVEGHDDYWLLPLHRPDRGDGRKRIQPIMLQVDELGRDQIKYAGCRFGDTEQAYITHQNRLRMRIAGQWFEFTQPKMMEGGDGKALQMRWHFPD